MGLGKAPTLRVMRLDDGDEPQLVWVIQRVGTIGLVAPVSRTDHNRLYRLAHSFTFLGRSIGPRLPQNTVVASIVGLQVSIYGFAGQEHLPLRS